MFYQWLCLSWKSDGMHIVYKSIEISLKYTKMTPKTRQKVDIGMETKASHMLIDHCYAFGLMMWPSKEVLWRRGPRDLFWPRLDPLLGGSGWKTTTLVRNNEYFIPTKFHQNPSSGYGEKVENVKSLIAEAHRTDDGRHFLEPLAQMS